MAREPLWLHESERRFKGYVWPRAYEAKGAIHGAV